jgi:hypothetical protein
MSVFILSEADRLRADGFVFFYPFIVSAGKRGLFAPRCDFLSRPPVFIVREKRAPVPRRDLTDTREYDMMKLSAVSERFPVPNAGRR